jgi:hypothetical protein
MAATEGDTTKWTPTEVRGLVNDVLKWALLVLALLYTRHADQSAADAGKSAAVLAEKHAHLRAAMGLPPEPK